MKKAAGKQENKKKEEKEEKHMSKHRKQLINLFFKPI